LQEDQTIFSGDLGSCIRSIALFLRSVIFK
jgi:hypothetical protein